MKTLSKKAFVTFVVYSFRVGSFLATWIAIAVNRLGFLLISSDFEKPGYFLINHVSRPIMLKITETALSIRNLAMSLKL